MTVQQTLKPIVVAAAFGGAVALAPGLPASAQGQGEGTHVVLQGDEFEYQPGPPSLEEGVEYSVLYGDPGSEGVFAMRLRMPDGFSIAPHTHPRPEIVTVISGTFLLGEGEEADRDSVTTLEPGDFFAFDSGMAHYAFTEGETVVQLNSSGPWEIEYVNPEDDPRS